MSAPPSQQHRQRHCEAANRQTVNAGVGTRTSEMRKWPIRRIVPVSNARAYPATTAGRCATVSDTYDSATASTAAGIRMLANGMTSTFAGSDMVVVRWKYHAIGSASASSMMNEMKISSNAASTKPRPSSKNDSRRASCPRCPAKPSRNSRTSERNCAARVGRL